MRPSEQDMYEVLRRSASLPVSFGFGNEIDPAAQDLLKKVRAEPVNSMFLFCPEMLMCKVDVRQRPDEKANYKRD